MVDGFAVGGFAASALWALCERCCGRLVGALVFGVGVSGLVV